MHLYCKYIFAMESILSNTLISLAELTYITYIYLQKLKAYVKLK